MDVARQGFLEGRFHPDDIDGAISLFRRFHSIYYINKAIHVWTTGDSLIAEFKSIGDELHKEITAPASSPERTALILDKIDPLNETLTHVEDEFSYTLGEGSRWLDHLILRLLFGLVLTVEVFGLTLTILVSRGISRGLNDIIDSAEKIADGDLKVRAKVYSRDEIGILANAFNEMTSRLEENFIALKNQRKISELQG